MSKQFEVYPKILSKPSVLSNDFRLGKMVAISDRHPLYMMAILLEYTDTPYSFPDRELKRQSPIL